MENQKEDESGWQTADKRKNKKQRPSQTGPAPIAAVDDQKNKFKNNNRKTSGGRNPELNQRGPGNSSSGREKDSYRDVSSSSSSTTSTSTSSGRPRGGGPGYKPPPVPVTDNKQPAPTATPAVGQKIVWGKPVPVNAAPVVEAGSDASKKTNVLAAKPAWGSTNINNNTAVKADENVPAVKTAWGVQSTVTATAVKTEDVEVKKPATAWASIAAAAPSTLVVNAASDKSVKSEPIITPVKKDVDSKLASVRAEVKANAAPVKVEVQSKPAPAKAEDVPAKPTPALSAKPGWAAKAASAPPFIPPPSMNTTVPSAVVKLDDISAKLQTPAKSSVTASSPPVEEKTRAVEREDAPTATKSAPVLPVAEQLVVDKTSPAELPSKTSIPKNWAAAPEFIPSFPKSMPALPSAAAWATPGTTAQPEVTQPATAERQPVPFTVTPKAPWVLVDVTMPPPKIEAPMPAETVIAAQKENANVSEDAQIAVKSDTAVNHIASPTLNHADEKAQEKVDTVKNCVETPMEKTPEKDNSLSNVVNKSSPKVEDKITPEKANSTGDEKSISSDEKPVANTDISSESQTKLNYKDDQWSPNNTDGKKQYDRNFLLQLQTVPLSLEKPANLPQMDIIREKSSPSGKIPQMSDFTPGFIKPTIQRGSISKKQSRDGRDVRDGSKRSMNAAPKIIDIKMEEVSLHQAENAWKPNTFKETPTAELSQDPIAVLMRKARGILNKLCPQKFDILVEKFNELEIDDEEKLIASIDLIFEKAVDEPGFSVAYAKMCEVLQKKEVMVDVISPGSGQSSKQLFNFRKLLLTRCQTEFERDYMEGFDKAKYEAELAAADQDDAKKAEIQADWAEKEMRARRRSLGNIQFIGELYKLKMLSLGHMHGCIKKLINSRDEESLESLSKFLTTVGKDLEQETMEKMKPLSFSEAKSRSLAPFDYYFKDIEKMAEDKTLSSRVRFMLQDLVDLRRSQWKPRRDVAGPKTIDQIHKEVQREKIQQQLMNEFVPGRDNRGGRDGRDRERENFGPMRGGKKSSRSGQPPMSDDGWTNVQPSKASQRSNYERIDTTKIANLQSSNRRVDPENIQLGPTRTWGQGSMSQRFSRKEDTMPDVRNKFSMLNSHDGHQDDSSRDVSEDRQETRRGGPSRSMFLPHRDRESRETSMEADRNRAIEAVRNQLHSDAISAAGPSASVGPRAIGLGRPIPENLAHANEVLEQTRLLRGKPDLNRDDVKKEAKSLLAEFLNNENEKEAIESVCMYFHPSTMEQFVEAVLDSVLEKSNSARNKTAHFLSHLVKKRILLKKQYQTGFQTILDIAADLVVDIPLVWVYLAELIVPMLAEDVIQLSFLRENNLPKDENNFPGKFFTEIVKQLLGVVGEAKLSDLWVASSIKWEQFVPKEQVNEFVKSNNLKFTLALKSELSADGINSELRRLLASKQVNSDELIEWIKNEVGDRKTESFFIRALITAITEKSLAPDNTLLKEVLSSYKKALLYCFDGQLEREKEALYALQHLMHKLEHPSKVLHSIFECLYDIDIITEEALLAWESCDNPAEAEGKGVAIKSTMQFFSWLRSAEDAEDEDDAAALADKPV